MASQEPEWLQEPELSPVTKISHLLVSLEGLTFREPFAGLALQSQMVTLAHDNDSF